MWSEFSCYIYFLPLYAVDGHWYTEFKIIKITWTTLLYYYIINNNNKHIKKIVHKIAYLWWTSRISRRYTSGRWRWCRRGRCQRSDAPHTDARRLSRNKSITSWWWTVRARRRWRVFGRLSQRSCRPVLIRRWRQWLSGNPPTTPGQPSSWSLSLRTTAWASQVTSTQAPCPRRTDQAWL